MKKIVYYFIILGFIAVNLSLPVTQTKKDGNEKKEKSNYPENMSNVETTLEYERYLKEIVQALESDPDFRKKLDKADEVDIRSGKIAQELEYVNHHVRTKLDEIKRRELERLRSLAKKAYELNNEIDPKHLTIPQHLDHANEHTFEIEDLRKLIKKTSEDLAAADQQRRAEFKEYEMQKEFEHEMAMKEMNEEQRKKYQEELERQKQKHKKHEKVHQPGNKAQLEEVWEKQDHMDRQDFNPKAFFMIHDVDGNGFWDETEVKALFVKELDKVYQSGIPEDDMRERAEEMERMREHVFKETDVDNDGLISYKEFLDQTKREDFNKDPEWETVDQQPQYTHEEYLEFERRRKEEINRMMAQGLIPPHPNMPQGYYATGAGGQPQYPNGYQQHPQTHYQNVQQQQHYQHAQYQQQQQQQNYQHQLYQQQQQQQQHEQYQQQRNRLNQQQQQQLKDQQQQKQQINPQQQNLESVKINGNEIHQASNNDVNSIQAPQPMPISVDKNIPNMANPILQQHVQNKPIDPQQPPQMLNYNEHQQMYYNNVNNQHSTTNKPINNPTV